MDDRVRRVVRMAFAYAIFMLVLMSPAIAHAEAPSARVRFFQQYKVDMSGLPNTFSYRITCEDASAPYPKDEDGSSVGTFSLRRDEDTWLTFAFADDALTERGTLVFRYKAEPVTTELGYGLYYVDVLSNDLKAGVNVYYIEIYVMVASDGTIEQVIPTVHVESWDGPKVSDPGWRIGWDEEDYDLFMLNANAYWDPFMPTSGRLPSRIGGGYSYAPGGSSESNGNGSTNASANTRSSDATSGGTGAAGSENTGGAASGTGSGAMGAGANASTDATNGTAGQNAASGAAGSARSSDSAATPAGGATSSSAAGATAGTSVTGNRNASDSLATTSDPTPTTLALALVASASLLLVAGIVRRRTDGAGTH